MPTGLRWTQEQVDAAQRRAPAAVVLPPPKITLKATDPRAKYGNRKVSNAHGTFDSAKEALRFEELALLEKAGHITNLCRQVKFAIVVNQIHICDYVADATYMEGARRVVVDVKSEATRKLPVYRLKKKLLAAVLGIQIEEL